MANYTEETLQTEHPYKGKYVSVDFLEVKLPDRTLSRRKIVRRPYLYIYGLSRCF